MLIGIEKIKVKDRIRKDFGNIEELANDIKENGLINPPVVTPEYELIAGERRLRALQHLGYSQIEVRVMSIKDFEHQLMLEISENENRKDFTFSERMNYGKRIEDVERTKARERMLEGNNPREDVPQGRTRDIVAEQIGLGSGRNYEKAKYIYDNASPEIIQKLDSKQLSLNAVYIQLKEDKQKAEEQIMELKIKLENAENKPAKIIDKTDYNLINNLTAQKNKYESQVKSLNKDKEILERRVKLNQEESDKYTKLKKDIEFLNQQKSDLARQIESATELAGLTVKLQNILEKELAPIKYKRCIDVLNDSDVAVQNLKDIIYSVNKWSNEMQKYLPSQNKNIIETNFIEV